MDFLIAALAATFWIWVPALIFVPFIIWALFEGVWMYYVEGKVYCFLEKAYVTPEQAEMNHNAHYGTEEDDK